jgi:hypothetical protein
MRKTLLAFAAASLLVGSTAASAQSAQALSLAGSPAVQRAGAEMEGSSDLGVLRGNGWILGVVALGILIFVIVELNKDNELPGSP